MSFGLPKSIDDWLYIQFILFFLVGFAINVFSNGQATLLYIQTDYNMQPNFNQTSFTSTYSNNICKAVQEFTNKTYYQKNIGLYISQVLYWIISPLINIYFAFFVFNKEMWILNKDVKIQ